MDENKDRSMPEYDSQEPVGSGDNSGKKKVSLAGAIVGIVLVVLIILATSGDRSSGEFSKVLKGWGDAQEERSEEIVQFGVSSVEGGNVIPEHTDDGSNWSIPNILRRILGVS